MTNYLIATHTHIKHLRNSILGHVMQCYFRNNYVMTRAESTLCIDMRNCAKKVSAHRIKLHKNRSTLVVNSP